MKKETKENLEAAIFFILLLAFIASMILVGYFFNNLSLLALGFLLVVITAIWFLIPVTGFSEEALK